MDDVVCFGATNALYSILCRTSVEVSRNEALLKSEGDNFRVVANRYSKTEANSSLMNFKLQAIMHLNQQLHDLDPEHVYMAALHTFAFLLRTEASSTYFLLLLSTCSKLKLRAD